MKKVFLEIWFEDQNSRITHAYKGFATGKMRGRNFVISPKKLFYNAFGFEMPEGTKITVL